MKQKSGPILFDNHSNLNKSRNTIEWLPHINIINYESDQSSFSDVQNPKNFGRKQLLFDEDDSNNIISLHNIVEQGSNENSMNLIPLNAEHQNTMTNNIISEESVGIQGIRTTRKVNVRELKKL